MEAYGRYLLSKQGISSRVFTSESSGATLLIWTNNRSFPKPTGFSLVERTLYSATAGVASTKLVNVLQNQLKGRLPFLHIQYDPHMQYLIINGHGPYTQQQSAQIIGQTFQLSVVNSHQSKSVNSLAQVQDPFHTWSRNTFANTSKTDLDYVTLDESLSRVNSIIEIKRSNKIRVGKWRPFLNDGPNYLVTMSLCNALNTNFHTVHHEEMDPSSSLRDGDYVDLFSYSASSTSPNQSVLQKFAEESNRRLLATVQSLAVL